MRRKSETRANYSCRGDPRPPTGANFDGGDLAGIAAPLDRLQQRNIFMRTAVQSVRRNRQLGKNASAARLHIRENNEARLDTNEIREIPRHLRQLLSRHAKPLQDFPFTAHISTALTEFSPIEREQSAIHSSDNLSSPTLDRFNVRKPTGGAFQVANFAQPLSR